MKTFKLTIGLVVASLLFISPCIGQSNSDSLIARHAYRALKGANIANGITIAFGLASNIEMMAIGGFPLEVGKGENYGLYLSHVSLVFSRMFFSIGPMIGVSKARKILEPWREFPEKYSSHRKLFDNLTAAQVLTAVAPVLCVAGGAMMFYASTTITYKNYYNPATGYYEDQTIMTKPGFKTAGWVFVGAGLATSILSVILIGKCKRELSRNMGSLKISAGPTSMGFQYILPAQH